VFLADPRGGYPQRGDVRILRDGATAPGYQAIRKRAGEHKWQLLAEPDGWTALEAEERAYLDAEGDRLLYVAATRARDLLVVGRYAGKAGNTTPAWEPFEPHLTDAPELVVPVEVQPPAAEAVDLSDAAAAQSAAAAAALHERVCRPSWTATSVTAEIKRLPRMTGAGTGEADDDDPTRVVTADTPSRRADAGAAWGTLVHGLLEHAMRYRSATRDDLRRLAIWLTIEEPQLRDVIEQALDTVAAVSTAPFWAEARASGEVHEEAPFAVREATGGLPTVVSGVIDLVHRTQAGWKVVDYKTDRDGETADLAGRYGEQVTAYERAWARVAGAPVTSAVVGARPAAHAGPSAAATASGVRVPPPGAPRQPKLFE
jgi:ATP-dependent helicase/nuclease subunit A